MNLSRRQIEDLNQLSKNDKFPIFRFWVEEAIEEAHQRLENEVLSHQIAQLQGKIHALRDLVLLFDSEIPAVLSMPAEKS